MPKRARDFDDWDISSFEQGTDGLNLFGGKLRGGPPLRPRARAALRPATVLSRIKLRSSSASAAKTWKTSRPGGERVSISVSDSKLMRCSSSASDEQDRPSFGRTYPVSKRRLQSVVPNRIQGQTHLRAHGEGHKLMHARLPSLTPCSSLVVSKKT